jgi:hypothetical protein
MVTLGVDPNDPVGPPPDRVARVAGVMSDLSFQPLKSVAAIKAGEATGMFQAIGSGSNPYEVDTGILAETPHVSPNA